MNYKIKISILAIIFGILILGINQARAYSIATHAYLTSEIFDFYNKNFEENKIPDGLKTYLIDGARREDDVPRWMNHFYDPVYDRGLTDSLLGKWNKSKDWAQNSKEQNKLTYKVPATVASTLTALEQKKLNLISSETNFTWKTAIKYWLSGDQQKSMFTLGHILHLIEDASVPDHTRNDPHPGDSPYENWTEKFNLNNPDKDLTKRLTGKNPIILTDLNSYFTDLAKYSNNNFYSKDTIGIQSGYNLPQPVEYEIINNFRFALNKDNDGHFNLFKQPAISSLIVSTYGEIIFDSPDILGDYWSRLSTKSVQYGAGVINLFFQETEKAKNNPNYFEAEPKSFIASTIEAIGNFAANSIETAKSVIQSLINLISGNHQSSETQPAKAEDQSGEIELPKEAEAQTEPNNEEAVQKLESFLTELQTPMSEAEIQAKIAAIQNELAVIAQKIKSLLSDYPTNLTNSLNNNGNDSGGSGSAAIINPMIVPGAAEPTSATNNLQLTTNNENSTSTAASAETPPPPPPPDTIPPSAINDLMIATTTTSTITLVWTAPGNDATSGTAFAYDIRYSPTAITEENWSLAIQVPNKPAPLPAGQTQSFILANLLPNTPYFIAIKTLDEANNVSNLSNIANATTLSLPPTIAETDFYLLKQDKNELSPWDSSGLRGSRTNIGQVFKPLARGVLDSVTLSLHTSNSPCGDVFVNIYEWRGGPTHNANENIGSKLAVSNPIKICGDTSYRHISDITFSFDGKNAIVLEPNKYYFWN